MAILAKGARVMPPRMHRAYRLEMSGRTLLTLLSLLTLTGLVVFYLGVVTGKGLRDPNPPIAASAPAPAAGAPGSAAAPSTSGLTFNQALTAPAGQIEGLKTEQNKVSAQTDNLLARAQRLELDEVPAKPALNAAPAPAAKPAPAAPASKPAAPAVAKAVATPAAPKPSAAPAKPASKAPAVAAEGGFTVQVFSSTQQKNAEELMADLKKKGYPAYLNQFQASDHKTWYRVRVGHGTRAEADALAVRLKKESRVAAPRVLKQ